MYAYHDLAVSGAIGFFVGVVFMWLAFWTPKFWKHWRKD